MKKPLEEVIFMLLTRSQVTNVTLLKSVDTYVLTGSTGTWFRHSRFRAILSLAGENLQASRTVLSVYRSIRVIPKLDFKSIIMPYQGISIPVFDDKYGSLFRETLSELITKKVIKQDPSSMKRVM
jgi:hypothetical protein